MIDSDYDFCRKFGIDFAIPEKELELYNEVIGLKQENERLQKRNREIYDGFIATQEELSDYAEELEEEKRINQEDLKLIDELQEELLNKKLNVKDIEYKEKMVYKSRIEKAIKYIKENAWYMNKDDEEILDRVGIEGLLDILNGDNNE